MASANDTFTDTNGTALVDHTADSGETWSKPTGFTGTLTIITGDVVRGGGGVNDCHVLSFVPSSAEYDIEADLPATGTGALSMGLRGRQSTSENTGYWFFYHGSNGQWELRRLSAGSSSTIATYVGDSPIGTPRAVKLELRDAAKKGYVGGVERLSSTNDDITAANRAGIIGGDSSNSQLDNLVVTDAGVAVFVRIVGSNGPGMKLAGIGGLAG